MLTLMLVHTKMLFAHQDTVRALQHRARTPIFPGEELSSCGRTAMPSASSVADTLIKRRHKSQAITSVARRTTQLEIFPPRPPAFETVDKERLARRRDRTSRWGQKGKRHRASAKGALGSGTEK